MNERTEDVMERMIQFEPGYDCRRFECVSGSENCKPGSGGFHGVHGLNIRFVLKGDDGAVQFLLFTGWLPEPERANGTPIEPMAADLGYHSKKPMYEDQARMDECDLLEQGFCYYDGSSLNAEEPWRILCGFGVEALWEFLSGYYECIFNDAEYPKGPTYPHERRSKPRGTP